MSLFGNLKSDGLEESQDRLGGGFAPLETDIYTGKIKAFYAVTSGQGAKGVSLVLDLGSGKEYKETYWVTNKKGENFWVNTKADNKKVPLPGFTVVDDICLIVTGKPLCDQSHEDKVVKLYDTEAKKELPKSVPMLVEVLGGEISLGILKELHNKNVLQGNEYVPTAETREQNSTDKVFHTESKMTVVEARQGAESAKFWDSWLERNKGQTRDRRTLKDGQAGATGAPPKAGDATAAAGAPARKSLFGNK